MEQLETYANVWTVIAAVAAIIAAHGAIAPAILYYFRRRREIKETEIAAYNVGKKNYNQHPEKILSFWCDIVLRIFKTKH